MSINIQIVERKIEVGEYIDLRKAVGWKILDIEYIEKGLSNSLFCVCAQMENEVIGMARVIGDGSICFYIQDVIVKPQYQSLGVGKMLMESVMSYISKNDAEGAGIGLMSTKGKEGFYEKFGFWRRPNDNYGHGMVQYWEKEK
ncbi:MAG TPA: GNAT family N-acetyltransferase [Acetivibrio saccincola]|uniref:GNAT family N-acetyltransferase n=1 Tax=Acetivibrio saccincola TaxID=1677857 RepID=UPI002B8560DE|nr:GNAT family N-acetyltransferase [Acetivibrio saccincola]HOA96309.1 GNAT family N-acetyltransferase [Acetivibrio saccincola]HQD29169.1 GNAT family N-acetyltransferase [Acetivibrio saccincola]